MAKKDKEVEVRFSRRGFLNPDSGMAAFEADCVFAGYRNKYSGYCDLSLTDCSRKINLEFSYYSEKEMKQRLQKIALLKEVLSDIEAFIIANPFVDPKKEKE